MLLVELVHMAFQRIPLQELAIRVSSLFKTVVSLKIALSGICPRLYFFSVNQNDSAVSENEFSKKYVFPSLNI